MRDDIDRYINNADYADRPDDPDRVQAVTVRNMLVVADLFCRDAKTNKRAVIPADRYAVEEYRGHSWDSWLTAVEHARKSEEAEQFAESKAKHAKWEAEWEERRAKLQAEGKLPPEPIISPAPSSEALRFQYRGDWVGPRAHDKAFKKGGEAAAQALWETSRAKYQQKSAPAA
jgi:hypothetical protein